MTASKLLLAVGLGAFTTVAKKPNVAALPPMGWRSWNCYELSINATLLEKVVDAMNVKKTVWDGHSRSLLDIGYNRLGIDEGWESCTGVNGSYHDKNGNPIVNTQRFPSLSDFAAYCKSKGISPSWYNNNCSPCTAEDKIPFYAQDVHAWAEYGFDGCNLCTLRIFNRVKFQTNVGTKIDSCGVSQNVSAYVEAFESTGRDYFYENCNDGGRKAHGNLTYCPFHTFRLGNDIAPTFVSVVSNIQMSIPYLKSAENPQAIARPNCWPQPDMLEVGNTDPPRDAAAKAPILTHTESRTHFGLWAITSAPLILSFDLLNETMVNAIWDVISNTEAIEVNQQFRNDPGRLISTSSGSYNATVFHGSGNDIHDEETLPDWQVWAKTVKEDDGTVQAVLAANYHPTLPATIEVSLAELGLSSKTAKVRDVWNHQNGQDISSLSVTLQPHDSVFFVLTVT